VKVDTLAVAFFEFNSYTTSDSNSRSSLALFATTRSGLPFPVGRGSSGYRPWSARHGPATGWWHVGARLMQERKLRNSRPDAKAGAPVPRFHPRGTPQGMPPGAATSPPTMTWSATPFPCHRARPL